MPRLAIVKYQSITQVNNTSQVNRVRPSLVKLRCRMISFPLLPILYFPTVLLVSHPFTYFLKSTNRTTQAVLLSLLALVPLNTSLISWTVLKPIVSSLPTYIKDTNHALHLFSNFSLIPSHSYLLFVLDVSSLYTSIPHADDLKALKHYLVQRINSSIPTSVLLCLTELVLALNSFEFDGEHYPHTSGIAIGTKVGPAF
jgi:hypothetical protein